MLLSAYLALAGLSTLLAFANYRLGLWLMLLVGLLGDPVRKLTPDNPVFISVCFVPVFAIIYLYLSGAVRRNSTIFSCYPSFKNPVRFYLVCLGFAFFNALLRNFSSLPLIVYSLAQYLGIILAVRVGYYFIRREADLLKLVKVFILTTSVFLFTVLPHFLGLQYKWPVLKTMRFEGAYVHYHSGAPMAMLNGVFRSPEPMGWIAMVTVIAALFLLARGRQGIFWNLYLAFISLFGTFCILASGRRKFFLALFVFMAVFLILVMRKNVIKMVSILLVSLILFGVGWYYLKSKEELAPYIATAKTAYSATEERVKSGAIGSMVWAFKRDGFFGRGLGTSTQGAAHFQTRVLSKEEAGIESGPGKVLSELGVPGFLALFFLLWAYLRGLYKILLMKWFRGPLFITSAFLFSLVLTHFVSIAISHQIYGDPLIALMTGLTFGMLLAIPRMVIATTKGVGFPLKSMRE